MEQPREGAPEARQWLLSGPTPSSNARHDSRQIDLEKPLQGQRRDDASRSVAAQPTSKRASSFGSVGGANPVSDASHASLNGDDAQHRPVSFDMQPIANCQPHNYLSNSSNNGKNHITAASKPEQGFVGSPSATRTSVAPVSAAQTPAIPTETFQPPNPATNAHSSTLSPQTWHPTAKAFSKTAEALESLPNLITPASAVNGSVGSDSSRKHASSGDDRGSIPGQSPIGQPLSKPILKMKRTGQNFPISSPRSASPLRTPASLHQRTASSPNRKAGPAPPGGSSLCKAVESHQSPRPALSTAVNGPMNSKKTGPNPPIHLSTNCRDYSLQHLYKSADTRSSK